MNSIYSYTRSELADYFKGIGEKAFKSDQLFDWLYKKREVNFDNMLNLNKSVISRLKTDMVIDSIKIIKKDVGNDVSKYLFLLNDGEKIEAVVMYHDYGTSLCISTQVGCNMSCAFCESGRLKKRRNLEASEMVLQILEIEKDINSRISHIVLMGIGEPFDNYTNVMKFIKIINDSKGIDIGARHITISTCGLVNKIKEFTKEKLQVNLAISLHAPNNELRDMLMPINKVYKIEELISSIKEYISVTNRRVTFEYIMLSGINDTKECAIELSKLLKGMNCYVNLIPYNETNNIGYRRSTEDTILKFYDILKKNNICVTIRKEFGGLLSAACGQLRSHNEEELYLTDSGRVREHNEDNLIIVKNKNNEYLLAVADGMGGHKAGEVASSIAINHLATKYSSMDTIGNKQDAIKWIRNTVSDINDLIFKYTSEHSESKGMGTTLVINCLREQKIIH